MKKRMCLLLTLMLSLFVFSGKVEADDKVMYLECDYNNEIYVFAYIQSSNVNSEAFDYRVFTKNNIGQTKDCASSYSPACDAGLASDVSSPVLYWVKDTSDFDECVNNCHKISDSEQFTRDEIMANISKGICPVKIKTHGAGMYLAGTTDNYVEKSTINPQFAIYRVRVLANGNYTDYFEGYMSDGKYILLYKSQNNEIERMDDEYSFNVQHQALQKNGKNYFNIIDNSYAVSSNVNTETKIDSDSISNFVTQWVDNGYASALSSQIEKSKELTNNSSTVLNACVNINKSKEYDFTNYSSTNLINDLETAYKVLASFYSSSNTYNYCSKAESTNDYLTSAVDCTLYNSLGYSDIDKNGGELILTLLSNAINDEISKQYPDIDKTTDMDEYLESLYRCTINLDSSNFSLSDDEKKKIEDLRNEFEILADRQGLSVVEDCKSLIGTELIEKVRKYTNIVKIVIPIILIGFGIYDFGVAIFAGDEDKMKKAKNQFFMRLVVSVLIFLTPTVVYLILKIANSVWSFISPDSCGLF